MWEILARKVPWSWLQLLTVKQAVCEHKLTLPILEIWPGYVQTILNAGLTKHRDRPDLGTIHKHLLGIKNKGEDLTSEVLDGAFPDWYEFQCGAVYSTVRRDRSIAATKPCRSSEIQVMVRRSSSVSQKNARRRSSSIKEGLRELLKLPYQTQHSPRPREVSRFGVEIAERLASLRNIHQHGRRYSRSSWAKAHVLTRTLEGDIERIKNEEEKARRTRKLKQLLSRRRERAFSFFDEREFINLQKICCKYKKKDWSKIEHGLEKLRNSNEGFKRQVLEKIREARIEVIWESRGRYNRTEDSDTDAEFYSFVDGHLIGEIRLPSKESFSLEYPNCQCKGQVNRPGRDTKEGLAEDVRSSSDSENETWEDASSAKNRESIASKGRQIPIWRTKSFAISDFLRETESSRKIHMEMMANRASSTQSALPQCTREDSSRRKSLSKNMSKSAHKHQRRRFKLWRRKKNKELSPKTVEENDTEPGMLSGESKQQSRDVKDLESETT